MTTFENAGIPSQPCFDYYFQLHKQKSVSPEHRCLLQPKHRYENQNNGQANQGFQSFQKPLVICLLYSRLKFKSLVLKFDSTRHYLNLCALFDRSVNLDVCFVFINGWDWLICQKGHQIQIMPSVVKFQSKGFEIKSPIKLICHISRIFTVNGYYLQDF